MATFDSNLMANTDASPPVMNDVGLQGGRERVIQGEVELASASNGDLARLCRIPSAARITELLIANDDLDTGSSATLDIGVYDPSDDSAVDDDCYAVAGAQLQSAAGLTDHRFNALDIDTIGDKVWQNAGLSADPGGELDIVITMDTVGDADGTIAFLIRYTID